MSGSAVVGDHHFGASGHPPIEPRYYRVDGEPKRFFDRADIETLMRDGWTVLALEHRVTDKYVKPKALWELVAERSDEHRGHERLSEQILRNGRVAADDPSEHRRAAEVGDEPGERDQARNDGVDRPLVRNDDPGCDEHEADGGGATDELETCECDGARCSFNIRINLY